MLVGASGYGSRIMKNAAETDYGCDKPGPAVDIVPVGIPGKRHEDVQAHEQGC